MELLRSPVIKESLFPLEISNGGHGELFTTEQALTSSLRRKKRKSTFKQPGCIVIIRIYSITCIVLSGRDKLIVPRVCCAVDCGIVVNPDAATNLSQGAIVDAVGNALFGSMTFKNGRPQKDNFNSYRMIRHHEAPREIDIHFVDSDIDPTGMGEPPLPPAFGALANALYRATGKRFYDQPFITQLGNTIQI